MRAPTYSKSPRSHDQADRVIQRIYANVLEDQSPLVLGEIVESGLRTSRKFNLEAEDRVHFRKTFYPGAGGNPEDEYRRSIAVWSAIPEGAAKPLGYDGREFRARLIKGTAWAALSPFGTGLNYCPVEGKPAPIPRDAAEQYWAGLEKLHALFGQLHQTHVHGDAHRNQALMVAGPGGEYEVKLVDFEDAQSLEGLSPEKRRELIADDLVDLLQEARLLQKHILGPRHSPLGLASRSNEAQWLEI